MRTREEIIAEIQRVAKHLGSECVSQSDFERHGTMSVSGITYVFGSWNRAIRAAGLKPFASSPRNQISDAELMQEVIRLTRELGKIPSDREMGSHGRYCPRPYVKRWGTFAKARTAAYESLGFPEGIEA